MTSEPPPFPDYYEALGVRPDASEGELRAARREAAKRWHPDRNSGPDAEGMMRLVNEAWEVLGKPETRAEYDAVYFAWRAAEYARRATVAAEVRRGYVWERHEREAREAEERRAEAERASADVAQGEGRSGGAGHRATDANDESPDRRRAPVSGVSDRAIGVIFVGVIILVGLVVAVAFAQADRTGSGGSLSQSELATVTAIEWETIAARLSAGTIESTVGDGRIGCDWVPIGRLSQGSVKHFWATVAFQIPTTTSWSVGFLYHNPSGSGAWESDAATYLYQNLSGGPYVGHWTRIDGLVAHRVGRVSVSPSSALNSLGNNTMRIEVNERGSFLVLNDELQLHVPIEQLNPVNSRLKLCVGFFDYEESAYTLRYSGLAGGTR